MKDHRDFIRALGPADASFSSRVHQTLATLRKEEEQQVKKTYVSIALVAALVLVAAVAIAAASQWGILDFFNNRQNMPEVLPEASSMIQENIPQEGGETEWATFILQQALHDGSGLYMTLAVQPKDPSYMPIGLDVEATDPVSNLGPAYAHLDMSVREYAKQSGKKLLHTSIYDEGAAMGYVGIVQTLDFVQESDDTLIYMVQGTAEAEGDTVQVPLVCVAIPYMETDGNELDVSNEQRTELAFSLQATQPTNSAGITEAVEFPDVGIRVDKVTMTPSAVATHVVVDFTVIDQAAYALTDDGLWFEFLDATGNVIPDGSTGGSSGAPERANPEKLRQETSLIPMNAVPEEIVIRGYNCWTKERYEAHTIKLQ